jgi:hypothetical protein
MRSLLGHFTYGHRHRGPSSSTSDPLSSDDAHSVSAAYRPRRAARSYGDINPILALPLCGHPVTGRSRSGSSRSEPVTACSRRHRRRHPCFRDPPTQLRWEPSTRRSTATMVTPRGHRLRSSSSIGHREHRIVTPTGTTVRRGRGGPHTGTRRGTEPGSADVGSRLWAGHSVAEHHADDGFVSRTPT